MAAPRVAPQYPSGLSQAVSDWLLQGHLRELDGPHARDLPHHQHPWWQVMCLTGVDYFSTLGYQPGIAALAAGYLSPLATLVLVLITLFGALPMYKRVADLSPHGDGSISMLARVLPWWQGKLFVLCLIGFVATSFIITITLSAADATAHIDENPFAGPLAGQEILVTLALIGLLGAVFMKGFGEAVMIAVGIVAAYLVLNVVVIGIGLSAVVQRPAVLATWQELLVEHYGNPLRMVGAALLLFPRLALGLSGFETGVVVMPLVMGHPTDDPAHPAGRIRNTQTLLTVAAAIMSVLLLTSSVVTTLLIPPAAFAEGGLANGRALAYLAHEYLGNGFGTVYDLSTILILWFAGASAMAGLLNIVPRYLPRYGMAPDWTRATRPLVLVFTGVSFIVTLLFRADVDAQAGAYATGVLTVITSASIAVTLSYRRQGRRRAMLGFSVIALIFLYTTVVTVVEAPSGIKIAAVFIGAIVVVSLLSRTFRSFELRATEVVFDETAERFIDEAARSGHVRLIANHPDERNTREYLLKEREEREASHIPAGDPVLFLEVTVQDASDFSGTVHVAGETIGGNRVLRVKGASIPNALAAVLLAIRDRTGKKPHAYFGWAEGNPLKYLARFILFGEGDIAPVTHEILRRSERNPRRRPAIHIG